MALEQRNNILSSLEGNEMTDPTKYKNLSVDIETSNILVNWAEKEMRTPGMQIRWMLMKYAPTIVKEKVLNGEDTTPAPVPKIEMERPEETRLLRGITNTRKSIVKPRQRRSKANGAFLTEDGWERRRKTRGKEKYSKQPLHTSSQMYKVLLTMSQYEDNRFHSFGYSNFELGELDSKGEFGDIAKVTSTAWDAALIERRSLLEEKTRRGYYAYRLTPFGKQVLTAATLRGLG